MRLGRLSGHPEVDALARRLSVQDERMASFRWTAPVMAAMVLNALNLGLQIAGGQVTATRAALLVLTLALLAAVPFAVRLRRRRARAYRYAHDVRYGVPGEAPPRKPWVSGLRNTPRK